MKRLVIAGAVAFAAAGQAFAADLPQPMPPPPPQAPATYVPPVAPVYNWGGIYYGVNGGYGIGSSEFSIPAATPSSTGTFDVSGFLVGPTLGANFQTDAFVFGIEGDFDGSWMSGTTSNPPCKATMTCETKNTWLSTVRGRIGYASDRVLFYGTAGGAFGNIQAIVPGYSQSSTEPGWTAGAGVEFALADNLTARVEYLYVDLESATCSVPTKCGASTTIKFDTNLIRLGLDYKFR